MPIQQLRLILPSDRLARQVEGRLASQARVEREPAGARDLATIALLVSIGASLASAVAAQAQVSASRAQAEATRLEVLKSMLELRQQLVQQGQAEAARIGAPGGQLRSFAAADEGFLRELLGLPSNGQE